MLPRVFIDIDNTLIKPFKEISFENRLAITKYLELGGDVHLVTGKVTYAIKDLVIDLGLDKLVHAGANGGMILENGQEKVLNALHQRSEQVVALLKSLNIPYYLYYQNHTGYAHDNPVQYELDKIIAINEPTPILEVQHDYTKVIKVLIYKTKDIAFENMMKDKLKNLDDVVLLKTADDLYEFHDVRMTKANAVAYIKDDSDYCIAIGDSENDISMLECCNKSYVVANANEELKAQYEVVPACLDNGVAFVLNKLMDKYAG